MDKETDHEGKIHKPAKNHPWRKSVIPKVAKWAKESSESATVNNWKVGGGYDPKK